MDNELKKWTEEIQEDMRNKDVRVMVFVPMYIMKKIDKRRNDKTRNERIREILEEYFKKDTHND